MKEADYPAHGVFIAFLPATVAPSRYAANVALFPISAIWKIDYGNRAVYTYLLSCCVCFGFACAIKEARGLSAQLLVTGIVCVKSDLIVEFNIKLSGWAIKLNYRL